MPTLAGFLFLAVVMDAWSRRIVGWAFSADLKTRVVLDALDMALTVRKPESVIHHSDQGSQYTSLAFGNRCKDAGVRPSTGSVGDVYDNAMCESFFATLECELLDRHRFRSHSEARMAVFHFIERFYNPSRRHSALGYLSPIEYERKHHEVTWPDQPVNSPLVPDACRRAGKDGGLAQLLKRGSPARGDWPQASDLVASSCWHIQPVTVTEGRNF